MHTWARWGGRRGEYPPKTSKKVLPPRPKKLFTTIPPPPPAAAGGQKNCYSKNFFRKIVVFWRKNQKKGRRRRPKENFPPSFPPWRSNLFNPPEGSKTTPPPAKIQNPPIWPTPRPRMQSCIHFCNEFNPTYQ